MSTVHVLFALSVLVTSGGVTCDPCCARASFPFYKKGRVPFLFLFFFSLGIGVDVCTRGFSVLTGFVPEWITFLRIIRRPYPAAVLLVIALHLFFVEIVVIATEDADCRYVFSNR